MSATAWSQCAADYDFMGASYGLSPNPLVGETFDDGAVNVPYADVVHLLTPSTLADIPGIEDILAEAGLVIPPALLPLTPIISVELNGVTVTDTATMVPYTLEDLGLALVPNNNGDSSNENEFLGGSQYCASLEGTPILGGTFTMTIEVFATINFGGAPFAVDDPPLLLEGFLLTVVPSNPGCTDESACNFNPDATEDDGSCTYPEPGLDCDGECLNGGDPETGCNPVPGCIDEWACNFDPQATEDDGSCIYPFDIVYEDLDGDGIGGEAGIADLCEVGPGLSLETGDCDDTDNTIYPGAPGTGEGIDNNCDGVVDGDEVAPAVLGCTDMDACNYNEAANEDDGSCLMTGDVCDDGDDTTINDAINDACECVGEPDPSLSIGDLSSSNVKIFPNPVSETLSIDLGLLSQVHVRLMSLDGKQVAWSQPNAQGILQVDVTGMPTGTYVLQMNAPNMELVRQVVIGPR